MKVEGLEKWGDSIIEEKLSNGNTLYYVEREGMYFEVGIFLGRKNKLEVFDNVNEALMSLIIRAWKYKFRIRVFYGDIHTGRSWNASEFAIMGTIGRTTGSIKIPILVHNKRSWGGCALLLSSVIRIDDIEDKRTLWKLPNFHVEKMTIEKSSVNKDYPFAVMQTQDNGAINNIANFKTEEKAQKWIDFMEGKRYSK